MHLDLRVVITVVVVSGWGQRCGSAQRPLAVSFLVCGGLVQYMFQGPRVNQTKLIRMNAGSRGHGPCSAAISVFGNGTIRHYFFLLVLALHFHPFVSMALAIAPQVSTLSSVKAPGRAEYAHTKRTGTIFEDKYSVDSENLGDGHFRRTMLRAPDTRQAINELTRSLG